MSLCLIKYLEVKTYGRVEVWLHAILLNAVFEWLAPLLRIMEAPTSNLDLETGYRDWGFSLFS
jgi:hypothetical protein